MRDSPGTQPSLLKLVPRTVHCRHRNTGRPGPGVRHPSLRAMPAGPGPLPGWYSRCNLNRLPVTWRPGPASAGLSKAWREPLNSEEICAGRRRTTQTRSRSGTDRDWVPQLVCRTRPGKLLGLLLMAPRPAAHGGLLHSLKFAAADSNGRDNCRRSDK
jgi:hypothetical protein